MKTTIDRKKAAEHLECAAVECDTRARESFEIAATLLVDPFDSDAVLAQALNGIIALGEARGLRNAAHDVLEEIDEP